MNACRGCDGEMAAKARRGYCAGCYKRVAAMERLLWARWRARDERLPWLPLGLCVGCRTAVPERWGWLRYQDDVPSGLCQACHRRGALDARFRIEEWTQLGRNPLSQRDMPAGYMAISEWARTQGAAVVTVRGWIRRGLIPARLDGGRWLIREDAPAPVFGSGRPRKAVSGT